MTTWARVVNGVAREVTQIDPAGRFTPDIEAQFQVVPDGTQQNATESGGVWTNPPTPPPPPMPPAPPPPTVNGGRFYVLFTPAQRIAIKSSTDAMVKEFYETLQVCINSGEPIDLGSTAVQQGLGYLVSLAIITVGDVTRITANTLP